MPGVEHIFGAMFRPIATAQIHYELMNCLRKLPAG